MGSVEIHVRLFGGEGGGIHVNVDDGMMNWKPEEKGEFVRFGCVDCVTEAL